MAGRSEDLTVTAGRRKAQQFRRGPILSTHSSKCRGNSRSVADCGGTRARAYAGAPSIEITSGHATSLPIGRRMGGQFGCS